MCGPQHDTNEKMKMWKSNLLKRNEDGYNDVGYNNQGLNAAMNYNALYDESISPA